MHERLEGRCPPLPSGYDIVFAVAACQRSMAIGTFYTYIKQALHFVISLLRWPVWHVSYFANTSTD